jgi:chromate transporter
MNAALLLRMAIAFATTSIVSIGGIAAMIPEIHRQAVEVFGWMDDSHFATTFAISQIAPGPNILIMSLVGWRVAGLAGLLVATLATVLPTGAIALLARRGEARLSHAPWYRIARSSLAPIIVGLVLASGLVTARAAITGATGLAIAAAVALFTTVSRANPLIPLGAAIAAGVVAGRLGLF